ncbi:hypothetical protein [Eubacterium sp. MSJ-33]|jgi:hypothetical protein|uniref:hypothetical protein n=1 Tax=Eubacterium sp. MSJ-33 TaxID=2841528 RepID=UPI0015B2BB49|nr:hypothetical protein [Eubacterium sp. MSJ-33]QWT53812.1 hypothetical protein KP625_04120 [Eubacterium sp. MSJ-33]
MPTSDSLYTFPSNQQEALAMLYLQNQDLSGLTPAQLADKYNSVRDEIKQRFSEIRAEKRKGMY